MKLQQFLKLVGWKKLRRMKRFQDWYDLAIKHLIEGQRQVFWGSLLLKITLPKSPEGGISISIRPRGNCFNEDGSKARRRVFEPDEISMHVYNYKSTQSDTRNLPVGFRVYISSEEDGKLHYCEFKMCEPLENLRKVFHNAYVSNIVDGLSSYDGG